MREGGKWENVQIQKKDLKKCIDEKGRKTGSRAKRRVFCWDGSGGFVGHVSPGCQGAQHGGTGAGRGPGGGGWGENRAGD